MSATDSLAQAATALLGATARRITPLHGGDLSDVLLLQLSDGQAVVAKSGTAPEAEARMLRALAEAGAPVPQVLAVSGAVLVLSHVENDGGPDEEGWADLGTALRRLHATQAPQNGWPEPFAFANLPIANSPAATWPAFWAERRLLPEVPHLPPALARRIEALAATLPEHLPRNSTALLHGDLWSGNLLARRGRLAALIDPACYHGDGEVDLAMLHLFGSPGPAFAESYGPLPPGAETRRAIYQLWPAIVHARLFGAGYHGMIDALLSRTGH
ncbi:fructosamine kinase family protein [Vannielia litorea]|uniref:fructosamine kinase family protein n=1 Tax=Vannielia litorea TaxID=1217970 RepID=UPI001BCC0F2A|nr:fructosamine kinase family protein [Vannielia litorea]MBS8226424.1 aminoglycoside phosphotransferase [Vannielia litorea]